MKVILFGASEHDFGLRLTRRHGLGRTGSRNVARLKGRTENALLALPLKAAYMFRAALIEPLHGARSKTPAYRLLYTLLAPIISLLRRVSPQYVTTTEQIARTMLQAIRDGTSKRILETSDINAL